MSPPLWFVVSNDAKHGPFSGQQLIQFATSGKLKATHNVQHEQHTKGKAVPAGSLRDLQKHFSGLQPAPEQHLEDTIIAAGKQTMGKVASSATSVAASVVSLIPKRPPVAAAPSEQLAPPVVSDLGDFVGDGQEPKVVIKLLDRVRGVCTEGESPLYAAVQQRPVANFSPDAIVLTNKRFIVFRQKVLGRFDFIDYPWRNVGDVHVREEIMASTISFKATNGARTEMGWLPKAQARQLYRIAQNQEEEAHKFRREQMLEEKRAGAAQTSVNTAVNVPQANAPSADDPLAKLTQLKQMLDAGLIEQQEYDSKKSELLSRM